MVSLSFLITFHQQFVNGWRQRKYQRYNITFDHMKYSASICLLVLLAACKNNSNTDRTSAVVDSTTAKKTTDNPYGWLGTETLKTRLGDFEFKNGYPTADAIKKL